jgi:hypothetical protein
MNLALDRRLTMHGRRRARATGQETRLRNEDDTGFPTLSARARRALLGAAYARMDQLAQVSEPDLKKPAAWGPSALTALREAHHESGLSFHTSVASSSRMDCPTVSAEEVDAYLRDLEEPKRSTLETQRRTILEISPRAGSGDLVRHFRVPRTWQDRSPAPQRSRIT